MITIIKADKDLCKKPDGKGGLLAYQKAFLYESEIQNVKNIEEFSALLTELEGKPRYGVLRDEPKENGRGRRIKERFAQVPRSWLLLDHDAPAPEGCPDYVEEPVKAYHWMVEHHWPFLKGVGVHWQLGNSAGVVPATEKMSWHLWVMLDKPVLNASKWLESKKFDRSMTSPVQIHYTASPLGVNIPQRSGLIHGGLLSGVTENPAPTRSGVKYSAGYQCTAHDIAALDMEYEALNDDKGRHPAIRWWIMRAVSVAYPSTHDRAVDKLVAWGKSETVANSDVARLIAWAETGLADGSLQADTTLRPDLAFPDDLEEVPLSPSAIEAQEEALCCSSLVKDLKNADNRYDWLKANLPKVKRLDAIEQGRLREAWGSGVRVFDKALKSHTDGEEWEKDWAQVATDFLGDRKTPLIYVDGEWFSWNRRFYELVEEIWVKKEISDVIDEPSTSKVSNAFQQLQFSALRRDEGEPVGTPFTNGRLMPDGSLVSNTPENGGRYCLGFAYDASATCPTWERCLKEWFVDDERPLILRQWLKYLVGGRADIQKIMLFVGEQRGGKGTILNVMQALIGEGNYSTPSMSNMASDFGLQSSVGRKAMFISDAHLPQRDRSTILDRLKGISGKDRIDVNRKNLQPLRGVRLGQIIIACNQMDDIKDESNALIDRYSIIKFTKSFLGKEDSKLGAKIESELSGIFNWAMSCPDFVAFHEDNKGKEAKEDMSLSANPVRGWSKNCCVADEWSETKTDALYKSFEMWCEENSVRHVPNKNSFVRSAKNIFPESSIKLVREGLSRFKVLIGVKLTSDVPENDEEDGLDAF